MIRTIYISFLAILLFSTEASSQCTFNINSTNGYTVNVTLKPKSVNVPTSCNFGYVYTVNIDYTVTFTGSNIPNRLFTLQGSLGCTGSNNFFNLPKTPGTGTTVTANASTLKTDCATASVSSLGCNTIFLTIQGPGIATQTLSCNYVVCNSGTVAPNLSVSSKSNICPSSTIDLSTITANNTPAGTVLEWHTSATPNAGTKVTNPAAVGVGTGTYYATFHDLTADCYSPTKSLSVSATACCNAGTNSPTLNVSSLSNVCPATTANLSTVTASNAPAGTSLEWHTSATPSALTKITTTTAVIAGTYYATFYDATNRCYSPTRNLNVTITACCNAGTSSPTLNVSSLSNVCPATTANLSTVTASNTPAGTSLEWHTSATPSALTKITTTTAVIAGTYYATFYDATNRCYSPTRNLNVTITACCNAGTNSPTLNVSLLSNVCPATTANLSTVTASNTPAGTSLEWHTSATPSALTKITTTTAVTAGTYYATFYDATNRCYSPTKSLSASVTLCCNAGNNAPILSASAKSNICPANTVDLSTIIAINTPIGTVLEWHNSATPSSATLLSSVSAVGAGTYYATFHDLTFNCYSPVAAVSASVNLCCKAGNNAPILSTSAKSNICPANTVDLSTIIAVNTPIGTVLEWHNSATPSSATLLSSVSAVGAGTYYATFHDLTFNCYSPVAAVSASVNLCCKAGNSAPILSAAAKVNICPALTIDLTTISASNLPLGTVLEWHTSATPTALTKLNIVSSLSAGIYYATFHDLAFNCYSPTASITASIVPCCNAGNEAPLLSTTSVSNVCPALTINLTGITASNTPSGTVLELHTSALPSSTTLVSAPASVNIGTYYATFHDLIFNCYSPTTAVEANSASCAVPPITSGNDGGLESDGCLAEAIAQRNYSRLKTPLVSAEGKVISYDNPRDLQLFVEPSKGGLQTRGDNDLESFIPQKPFATATTSYITSPTDLIGITNAKKVVSVDYFDNTSKRRLAAILSTQTQDAVYNHTKVICDRLIGSNLLSTQKIEIDNKPFILSVLQRENGVVEYNINFSVNKENATTVLVTSQWSPEAYPAKPDYWNFQVWAESSTNAKKLALEILNKFKEQYPTLLSTVQPSVPKVFVKKGSYDNGILTLNIQNPIAATQITLTGNYTNSETQKRGALNKTITLSGAKEEVIELNVGGIFDFGFTMKNNKATEYDALYFADGAWGLDYNKQNSKVDNFEVNSAIPFGQSGVFTLERNPILRGTVKDYVSLFRSLRPASTEANMSGYQNLSFTASGNSVVEITLVKKSITDWAKQYRAEVRLYSEKQEFALSLKDFSNGTNQAIDANDLVDVVFTIKGDGKTAKPFEISIENLVFDNKARQRIAVQEDALKAYPNPASELTELIFNLPERGLAQISLSNFQGKALILRTEELAKGNNRITIPVNNLPSGMYIATITTAKGKMTTKVVVP